MNTTRPDFEAIRSVYFLGIGGIGMSAIARFFHAQGKKVAGYDKTPTALTAELEEEGIAIHFKDDPAEIPTDHLSSMHTLVVLTPAIPSDHQEWAFFRQNGFTILKRSQVLGVIADHHYTVAVAGTHGKTTTSTMIAHLLRHAGVPCSAFLGGIAKNFQTNLLIGHEQDGRHLLVVEADEYDRSFLTLHPDLAVITSMDPDHLDIYGTEGDMQETYRMFAGQVKRGGCLIRRKGLPIEKVQADAMTYSLNGPADVFANAIRIHDHQYRFDWTDGTVTYNDLTTQLPGAHNVENAIAAVAAVKRLGLTEQQIRAGLAAYTGVRRRFDYQVRNDNCIYVDDYAHHPEELKACIRSARDLYPGRHLTGIFQPHLFTRTRDFLTGFAESLSLLDRLVLLDIYPARELPIPGITSSLLLEKVSIKDKHLLQKQDVVEFIKTHPVQVLLTLGAGDIDQLVEPLRNTLINR
ncbi:MAG: UDP-N-acetylmuramate--L-alanine ligase [Bacteroidota bacterium]